MKDIVINQEIIDKVLDMLSDLPIEEQRDIIYTWFASKSQYHDYLYKEHVELFPKTSLEVETIIDLVIELLNLQMEKTGEDKFDTRNEMKNENKILENEMKNSFEKERED